MLSKFAVHGLFCCNNPAKIRMERTTQTGMLCWPCCVGQSQCAQSLAFNLMHFMCSSVWPCGNGSSRSTSTCWSSLQVCTATRETNQRAPGEKSFHRLFVTVWKRSEDGFCRRLGHSIFDSSRLEGSSGIEREESPSNGAYFEWPSKGHTEPAQ